MGILAISEYMRHAKRNLFVVLQISVLLFVLCVSITTLQSEYKLYRPVSSMNGKNGIYISSYGYHGETPESIAKGMKKVNSVYTWASTDVMNGTEENGITMAVYPQNVLEDFKPTMQEGKWLSETETEDGLLPIVVSKNPNGWKCGSTISLQYGDENGKLCSVQARVVGVLEEGSQVIGYDFGEGGILNQDYRDIFSTYRYEQEQSVFLMTSEQQAKKKGISYTYNQDHFIIYQDDITEYEMKKNSQILKNNLGLGTEDTTSDCSLDLFMKNSNHQLQREIMMYLPIVICVLVITIISLVNVCTLNMADDMYHNAIFSLLGLPWKKCSFFSLLQSLLTAFLSVILFLVLVVLSLKLNLTEYLLIELNRSSVGALATTLLILCIIHYVVPYSTLCKKQPVEVLRNRKE